MKSVTISLTITILFLSFVGCSDEPPSIRIFNQHTEKANVQVKPANSNTFNYNDVTPATYTNYTNIKEGICEVIAVIQNDTSAPSTSFRATENHNYTVVIAKGNPSTLRVDTREK